MTSEIIEQQESFSSEDLLGTAFGGAGSSVPPVEARGDTATFDLTKDPIPSFGALQEARAEIFHSKKSVERYVRQIEGLESDGETGRRKGLGLWMIGRYDEAADQLAPYEGDDVASFTRANALLSAERYEEAQPIFERLSQAYPDEPRPRAGLLEARLEAALAKGDVDAARAALEQGFQEAPASFSESAEGSFLRGRAAELERNWGKALDEYARAIELDPDHRRALFLCAHLAERNGLDELALVSYRKLVHMHPVDKATLMNLGVLYEDMGRDQDAAACYDTVVRSFPTDPRARLFLDDARAGMEMFYDEDLERKEDRLNQILRTPITDFELSVRARNCLSKMNIVTLGDLVRKTEQELLSYKNFGETSLNEIKEILLSKNLRLGMAHEEAVASIEAASRPRATGENAEVLNRPISDLELSIRARRTVENLGCLTVGDVVQHSEDELLGMPNFGQTSLQELKRKLTDIGVTLKAKDKKRKK